jgi:hypothetical protein
MARYRKVDPRIWGDENFRPLSKEEKLVALYILSGDQTNPIGIFCFSQAKCAEDLDISLQDFDRIFSKVLKVFRWKFDRKRKVLYIPTWWKYNTPENPNVLKSFAPFIQGLPQTYLYKHFASNLRHLAETFHESFRETFPEHLEESSKALGKASPKACPKPSGNSKSNSKSNGDSKRKPLPSPPGGPSEKKSKQEGSLFERALREIPDEKKFWAAWLRRLEDIQLRVWGAALLDESKVRLLIDGENGRRPNFGEPSILWLAIAKTKTPPRYPVRYLQKKAEDQDALHKLRKQAEAMTDNDFG